MSQLEKQQCPQKPPSYPIEETVGSWVPLRSPRALKEGIILHFKHTSTLSKQLRSRQVVASPEVLVVVLMIIVVSSLQGLQIVKQVDLASQGHQKSDTD